MRTSIPYIWAAGDVIGEPFATPVSARQGVLAAESMAKGSSSIEMDYTTIPRTAFTDPEVAAVGLTLGDAQKAGLDARESRLDMQMVPRAACMGDTRGFIKMVMETGTRRVLGVHIVAPSAGEIVHEATVAMRAKWTVDDLIATIHVYPTMAESVRMVAQTFNKDVSKLSCCAE